MKRSILYLLLIIYTASIFKPILPFATDVVAHTFFYYKHVSTVHSINGKNHVHHELIHEAKKDTAPGKTDASKKMNNTDDHFFLTAYYNLHSYLLLKQQQFALSIAISKKHAECNFPPPKAYYC